MLCIYMWLSFEKSKWLKMCMVVWGKATQSMVVIRLMPLFTKHAAGKCSQSTSFDS